MGKKFMVGVGLVLCVAVSGAADAGEILSARVARSMLYKVGKNPTEVKILREDLIPPNLIPVIKMGAKIQKYYEALAVSPSEGLQSGSAFQAINFHSEADAASAATTGCNAKKKKDSDDCVVVAEFLPKGYDGPRKFSLSAIATATFAKKYRWSRKNKAFAISPLTGNWGQATKATSAQAARSQALAACSAMAGVGGDNSCVIVSEN